MPGHPTPTVLALDAAGSACSAALWRDGAIAAHRFEAMDYGHAEVLMPMVEEVIAGTGYDALDLIGVGVGPGAYTGLRIALSAARGLALATGLPVLGIGSVDAHLARVRANRVSGQVAVVLETRRADVYLALFAADDEALVPVRVLPVPDAAALLAHEAPDAFLTGDAVPRFVEAVEDGVALRGAETAHGDAGIIAGLAAARFAEHGAPDGPPRPLYLRAPDTTPPGADRQRLR